MDTQFCFELSLLLYIAGAIAAIVWRSQPRWSSSAAHILAAVGALFGLISGVLILLGQPSFQISVPLLHALTNLSPSVQLFECLSLQVDALSAFFVLVISLLVLPVS